MIEQDSALTPSHQPTGFSKMKSWRGYLFEFILLFMAVFLGFVAENFRVKLSEKEQAEELAHNFYDELLADSVAIQWYIQARFDKDTALVALKDYVRDSSLEKVSATFIRNYYVGLFMNFRFEPTDVVLEQLKNSGSLIYFKSEELQRLTGNLSECIARMRQTDREDGDFIQAQFIPFQIEHGDQLFYDRITSDGSSTFGDFMEILIKDSIQIDYHINDISGFNRVKFINMIGIFRVQLNGHTSHHYLNYKQINTKLLSLLRKEYDID